MSRAQQRRPAVGLPIGPDADDADCQILHVDMDAFFAMVEVRERPDLVGKPVIVGGAQRGVVLSATYEARAFGVHSAMPMTRALRACPQAVVVPPRHGVYAGVSTDVFDLLGRFTPLVEPLSLDEAFLDVSAARRTGGRPAEIGAEIRRQIRDRHGITASVGIAATKFVAKLASTLVKPDGLLVVPAARTLEFLHPLPIGTLWGVGERTEAALISIGLRTVGDLAAAPEAFLARAVGSAAATHLRALAAGVDPRVVTPGRAEKSISAEETFPVDTADSAILERELRRLADRVGARLRAASRVGRTVTLKIRYADFTTITRARTVTPPTATGYEIFRVATDLLHALGTLAAPVRLVGLRVEGLSTVGSEPQQLALPVEDEARTVSWSELDSVLDRAASRFGPGALAPASLLDPGPDRSAATRTAGPASSRGTDA